MASTIYSEKCIVVPQEFFEEGRAKECLNEFFRVDPHEKIFHITQGDRVLIYVANEKNDRPELYNLLEAASHIDEANKIVASYKEGVLFLVIFSGQDLLLCNSFKAVDFPTAEYFIFLAMNRLQLNTAVSSIYFRTPLTSQEAISLMAYFKKVESLCE